MTYLKNILNFKFSFFSKMISDEDDWFWLLSLWIIMDRVLVNSTFYFKFKFMFFLTFTKISGEYIIWSMIDFDTTFFFTDKDNWYFWNFVKLIFKLIVYVYGCWNYYRLIKTIF